MKPILFVNPSNKDDMFENIKVLSLPPLNLAALAGYTPENYEVAILDEAKEKINFDSEADLVAITCMTPLAPRACEISSRFREKGAKVVLGGIHPSMMPDEASSFADAVVIGEGEGIWRTVLRDFETEALSMMNKHINLGPSIRNFKDAIRKVQDHGIAVIGGFIFGNDSDTEDIFDKRVDFVHDSKIDGAQFSIQTPLSGNRNMGTTEQGKSVALERLCPRLEAVSWF